MGPTFTKIHSGLLKMYQEEVLGKRVVVQHLCLAGDWLWEGTSQMIEEKRLRKGDAEQGGSTGAGNVMQSWATSNDRVGPDVAVTKAPWAK